MAGSLAVLMKQQAAAALRTWRLVQHDDQHQRAVMSGVVAQLQGRGVRRAWVSWQWARREHRRLSRLVGSATRAESGALAWWARRAAEVKLVRRAAAAMRRRGESRALRVWASQSVESAERSRLLRVGASGLVRRAEQRAWTSWQHAA